MISNLFIKRTNESINREFDVSQFEFEIPNTSNEKETTKILKNKNKVNVINENGELKFFFRNKTNYTILNILEAKFYFSNSELKDITNNYSLLWERIKNYGHIHISRSKHSFTAIKKNIKNNYFGREVKHHEDILILKDTAVIKNNNKTYIIANTTSYTNMSHEYSFIKKLSKNRNEDEPPAFKKKSSKWILALSFIFIFAFIFAIVPEFDAMDYSVLSNSLRNFGTSWYTLWFWLLMFDFLVWPIWTSGVQYVYLSKLYDKTKFWDIYITKIASSFIAMISPSYIFGLGAQTWILRRRGYKTNDIVSSQGVSAIVIGLYNAIVHPLILIFTNLWLVREGANAGVLHGATAFGYIWVLLNKIFYVAIMRSRGFHGFITWTSTWISMLLNRYTLSQRWNRTIASETKTMAGNFDKAVKNWDTTIYASLILTLRIFWIGAVRMSSYMVISRDANIDIWKSIGLNSTINYASLWIPVPGKLGLSEFMNNLTASSIMQSKDAAGQVTYINRLFNYYFRILSTMIPFIIITSSRKFRRFKVWKQRQ